MNRTQPQRNAVVKHVLSGMLAIAATVALGTALAEDAKQEAADTKTTKTTVLNATDSNPKTLGWMQGFPPPADKTIRFTDPDYFAFPKLRWTACHFRELMPTVAVRTGTEGSDTLWPDQDHGIDAVSFTPLGSETTMTWDEAFDANYTDGVMVIHKGKVVYERYDGCLDENTLHGAMSVTKSLTGLLAEILVAEGKLHEKTLVRDIIPELKDSAFGDATVRQVLEMTTALDYSEDYSDPNAEVWTYAEAGSPLPKPEDYDQRSYFDYLQTVKKAGEHGEAFGYKTVNADAAGWLVARTTGVSVAEYLSNRIWSQIGTEREAFYTVDSIGTPFAGGGFNATLRDLGRFGLLLLNEGRVGKKQVIPAAAIKRIAQGGDKAAFAKAGYALLPDWSYRSMWWVSHNEHGAFAARGVHGQTVWIDPTAEMVIVRFATHPVAGNAANDPTSLPAYQAVAEYLMAQDKTPQLVGRKWLIEDIAGRGVIDNSPASLVFMPEGRLAGNATCNQLITEYTAETGKLDKLSVKPGGATMMLCPPALMEQEERLLKLLPKVTGYTIDDTGALILKTAGDETITARRR